MVLLVGSGLLTAAVSMSSLVPVPSAHVKPGGNVKIRNSGGRMTLTSVQYSYAGNRQASWADGKKYNNTVAPKSAFKLGKPLGSPVRLCIDYTYLYLPGFGDVVKCRKVLDLQAWTDVADTYTKELSA